MRLTDFEALDLNDVLQSLKCLANTHLSFTFYEFELYIQTIHRILTPE